MLDIYGLFKKVPGGSLLFPMFTVALINTIFPNLLASFGGMTTAMYKTGTLTIAGIILFATGAGINVKTLGTVLKRCGTLTIVKFAIAFIFGYLFVAMFGQEGILGVNAVAFVVCMCSCNPGVFMGLAADYGEQADLGNFAVMNLVSMPCWPILILATATGGAFDIMSIVTVLVPFFLGMLLGNIDPNFAKMMGPASPILIPFMGACFGASINLIDAAKAGLAGIILAVIFLVLNVPILTTLDKGTQGKQQKNGAPAFTHNAARSKRGRRFCVNFWSRWPEVDAGDISPVAAFHSARTGLAVKGAYAPPHGGGLPFTGGLVCAISCGAAGAYILQSRTLSLLGKGRGERVKRKGWYVENWPEKTPCFQGFPGTDHEGVICFPYPPSN